MRRVLSSAVGLAALLSSLRASADPPDACSDAYTSAQVQRKNHALIEARASLHVCAQSDCPGFIVRDCDSWLGQVESSIPSVVPIATDASGNDLPGVRVDMDGAVLLAKIDGRAVDVNPGQHTLTFVLVDGTKTDKVVVVAEGEKNKRVGVTFGAPEAPMAPAPAPAAAPLTPAPAESIQRGPWTLVGIAATGAGAVALGAGAIFGGVAVAKAGSSGCQPHNLCPTPGDAATLSQAQDAGNIATALLVGGAVVAAAGIVLWVVSPGSHRAASSVGVDGAKLELRW